MAVSPFACQFGEDSDFDETFFLQAAHHIDDRAICRALVRAHENARFGIDLRYGVLITRVSILRKSVASAVGG